MRKKIGFVLLVASIFTVTLLAFSYFRVGFYIRPPIEKLTTTLSEDIHQLEKSKKLPKEWQDIREIRLRSDNSPIQEWIPKIKVPAKVNANGRYRLEVFFVHWIEGYRYGTVVQFNLVEIASANTVWELGRTYKLGFVY